MVLCLWSMCEKFVWACYVMLSSNPSVHSHFTFHICIPFFSASYTSSVGWWDLKQKNKCSGKCIVDLKVLPCFSTAFLNFLFSIKCVLDLPLSINHANMWKFKKALGKHGNSGFNFTQVFSFLPWPPGNFFNCFDITTHTYHQNC